MPGRSHQHITTQLLSWGSDTRLEVSVAVVATMVLSGLLLLLSRNAGPLWRDETNTINIVRMPLRELWQNLPFESFPALYLMVLRGWSDLGMADTDAGIRLLGFLVGLSFLVSLWACARWIKAPAPTLSLALLGSLPAFLFTVEANRAYGLAMVLALLAFGLIWRMVERPSPARVLLAGLVGTLFLHCVYYDAIFLAAMLAGASLVAVRRGEWKKVAALFGIGALGGATMLAYLPVIRRGTVYARIVQVPFCDWTHLWNKLNDCLSATSSAEFARSSDFGAFVWIGISGIGVAAAVVAQHFRSEAPRQSSGVGMADLPRARQQPDLALYSAVTFICGVAGYLLFLRILHFSTQVWYYMVMVTLCAITLEGLLNAGWPGLRPWGAMRLALLVVMSAWGGDAVWREAHTRRSSVDLVSAVLNPQCVTHDLIIVQDPWVAITFDRYYHGLAGWLSIPAIGSHKVHRTDLISEAMMGEDPSPLIIGRIKDTLQDGHTVWLVGHAGARSRQMPAPPLPPRPGTGWWFEPYGLFWDHQVNDELVGHAAETSLVALGAPGPVTTLEDVPLLKFHGYRATLRDLR